MSSSHVWFTAYKELSRPSQRLITQLQHAFANLTFPEQVELGRAAFEDVLHHSVTKPDAEIQVTIFTFTMDALFAQTAISFSDNTVCRGVVPWCSDSLVTALQQHALTLDNNARAAIHKMIESWRCKYVFVTDDLKQLMNSINNALRMI
jgi:hypothetical protein